MPSSPLRRSGSGRRLASLVGLLRFIVGLPPAISKEDIRALTPAEQEMLQANLALSGLAG